MREHGKVGGRTLVQSMGGSAADVPGRQSLTQDLAPINDGTVAVQRQAVASADVFARFHTGGPTLAALFGGPVQRAAHGAPTQDAAHVHAAAMEGISGAGGPLPHLEQIQRSFGRHDVSHIQAHVGGSAATGAGT